MHQCYLDAMALVARFGKPDFFLTMTANPTWQEIQSNLRPGEAAHNRPDLVSRVFRQKLRELMKDLLDDAVLGTVVAYTYVVEFQKHGLPHVHVLLVMDAKDKPRTAHDIDRLVSAELPSITKQKPLRELVERYMVHGPCGELNPH